MVSLPDQYWAGRRSFTARTNDNFINYSKKILDNLRKIGKAILFQFILPGIAGGIVGTILLNIGDSEIRLESLWWSFLFNFLITGFLWFGNGFLADKIPIPWTERPLLRFVVILVLTIVYTILAALLVQIIFQFICCGNGPEQALKNIDTGFYGVVLLITFFVSLFLHGRTFLFSWKDALVRVEQAKQAQLSASYESLKNQVNPHFLFNSLNVLSSLVYKDPDMAAKFIKQMSRVYRYVLDIKGKELVSLSEELKALEAYLFMIKMRFGEGIQLDVNFQPRSEEMIAPLTLQMLVENAVKHNVANKNHPLYIRIERKGMDYLTVTNTLNKKDSREESLGVGLPNLQNRYRLLTDKAFWVKEEEDFFVAGVPLLLL